MALTRYFLLVTTLLLLTQRCLCDDCQDKKVNLPPPENNQALLCKDSKTSPKPGKPVLVSSWNQFSKIEVVQETYIPRYSGHKYEPVASPGTKDKYKDLDLFFTSQLKNIKYKIFFQRQALVYLFVDIEVRSGSLSQQQASSRLQLQGWTSEGWAELKTANPEIEYGTYEKAKKTLFKYVYVFSKTSNQNKLNIPDVADINFGGLPSGLKLANTANLWIAESNGGASPSIKFKSREIANRPCPREMHNQWSVGRFLTWHPLWDPCYWCTYGHEHGSSPKKLFGYEPKFNLPSTKLRNDDETNEGIKGFAFSLNNRYFVYFSLHSQLSTLRRVRTRYHSVNLVVADKTKRPPEIVADIHYKADFGYNAVRPNRATVPRSTEFITVRSEDENIKKTLPANGKRNLRTINIIDRNNLTALKAVFNIRNDKLGNYEEWRTVPICTKATGAKNDGLQTILKYPGLAVRSERMDISTSTELGLEIKGVKYRSVNLERVLKTVKLAIDQKSCPQGRSGVFYTDPFGNVVPKRNRAAIKQIVKKDLKIDIQKGRWEPVDAWQGLYGIGDGKGCGGNKTPGEKRGKEFLDQGFFLSLGYGVDPKVN